jgi:hypothetical protein
MKPKQAVLVCSLLAATALPARAQFSALPGVVRLAASDSAELAIVQIRNEGGRPMQFRLYVGDYDQNENGDYQFQESGANPSSCDGRISFFPDNTVLAPGERQEVQIRMEAGAVCWGLLFIESAAGEDGQVRVAQRIGVRVLNVPAALPREGEIIEVTTALSDSLDVDFAFHNTGAAPVELRGAVELRDLSGAVVATTAVGPLGVLPAHVRRVAVRIPAQLAPGQYLAVPILEFGAEYLAGGQALVRVP